MAKVRCNNSILSLKEPPLSRRTNGDKLTRIKTAYFTKYSAIQCTAIQCTNICSLFCRWLVLSEMEHWETQMWEPLTRKSVLRPTGNLAKNKDGGPKLCWQPCFVYKCTSFSVFSLRFFKSYREIDTVLSDNTSNNGWSDLRSVSQPTFQTEKLPKGLLLFRYVAEMAPV